MDRLLRAAHESNAELDRAMDRLALTARTGDLGFPVGFLFIEPTLELAAFRDRRPRMCGSRYRGDLASLRERNLTGACGLTFIHGEAARQLRGCSCALHLLSVGIGGGVQQPQQHRGPH